MSKVPVKALNAGALFQNAQKVQLWQQVVTWRSDLSPREYGCEAPWSDVTFFRPKKTFPSISNIVT